MSRESAFRGVGTMLVGKRRSRTIAAAIAASLTALTWGQGKDAKSAAATVIAIKAKLVYTAGGAPIENAIIIVRDGKLDSLGAGLQIPEGANVIEIANAVVTPGLIDAHTALDSDAGEMPARNARRRNMWERMANEQAERKQNASRLFAAQAEDPAAGQDVCPHPELHDFCEGICPHCGAVVTHGEADLAVGANPAGSTAEQSSEVTPQLRVLDSINLLSNDFERLMRGGVTTVWVSPDSASVIGMRGAIVKTAGALKTRVVREADAVKASMGGDSFRRGAYNIRPIAGMVSFMTRRPTTRMGVAWVFRKAFYDAMLEDRGGEMHGADTPPSEALPTLVGLLRGEIPLRIQARKQHDILTALRLAEEFGLGVTGHESPAVADWRKSGKTSRSGDVPAYPLIIEEATEAYRCLPELKAAGVPLIYGPIFDEPEGFRSWTGEANEPRLNTAQQLRDAGIKFALTANDLRDEEGLVRQAMSAVRYGLSKEEALKAVTSVPAELMGLGGKVGTLAPGAAADLVVWSGEPFEGASRAMLVMIDGQVVYRE